jgi:hypothetical protein
MAGVVGLEWVRGREEPLEGTSRVDFSAWETLALDRPEDFAADLEATGFSSNVITDALRVRGDAALEVDTAVDSYFRKSGSARKAPPLPGEIWHDDRALHELEQRARTRAFDRIRDWFADRKVVVEERQPIEVKLPLFVLAAPGVKGATVAFEQTKTRASGVNWSISLAGSGLSGEVTVELSMSAGFEASARETKLVFLPVTVVVEKLRVAPGSPATFRVDLEGLRDQQPAPGLLLLARGARPAQGSFAQKFSLAGDTTGAPATYKYTYNKTKTLGMNIGIKAYGADLSLGYKPTMSTSVALTFTLPGGHDYELYRLAEGDGLLWGR